MVQRQVSDRMKVMNMARCCKEIDHIEINQSLPNYMKPTRISDARKQQRRQVSDESDSGSRSVRGLKRNVRSKSLELSMKKITRATCSSTLKDSKSSKALELSPEATEAEGTSAIRVCPYKYCSLNGHLHDALPPLKRFLASRRKAIETERVVKQKGCCPSRKLGFGKGLDTGQGTCRSGFGTEISSLIEEIGCDFFVEIYAKPQERFVELLKSGESVGKLEEEVKLCSDVSLDADVDQSSELSIDDLQVVMGFLKFVSRDEEDEVETEKFSSSIGEEHVEGKGEAVKQMEVLESIDINLGEDADHPFADDRSNFSDDALGPMLVGDLLDNDDHNGNSKDKNICTSTTVSELKEQLAVLDNGFQSVSPDSNPAIADEISDTTIWIDTSEERVVNETASLSSLPELDDESQRGVEGNITDYRDVVVDEEFSTSNEHAKSSRTNTNKVINRLSIVDDDDDECCDANLRMFITRKARNDELEQSNEFNMRPPNFLPEEPDPESEKVDLKHQIVDERKNAEEWMIDFALQQAVSKLGPARRQKVALLVEAFEAVIPLPPCDKTLSDSTQSFCNPRALQACSYLAKELCLELTS